MALEPAVEGAKRPSQVITWTDQDGNAFDLTNATITARITNLQTGESANSDGAFILTDAPNGGFRWDYGTNDVATSGKFAVQFTAVFSSGVTPARTIKENWTVYPKI